MNELENGPKTPENQEAFTISSYETLMQAQYMAEDGTLFNPDEYLIPAEEKGGFDTYDHASMPVMKPIINNPIIMKFLEEQGLNVQVREGGAGAVSFPDGTEETIILDPADFGTLLPGQGS